VLVNINKQLFNYSIQKQSWLQYDSTNTVFRLWGETCIAWLHQHSCSQSTSRRQHCWTHLKYAVLRYWNGLWRISSACRIRSTGLSHSYDHSNHYSESCFNDGISTDQPPSLAGTDAQYIYEACVTDCISDSRFQCTNIRHFPCLICTLLKESGRLLNA
jgi:hypothetical protein